MGKVLHGDAVDRLRELPDRSIGMIISDPPFFTNIGREAKEGFGHDPWSDVSSIESAASWGEPVMREIRRVTRKGGAVVLMAGVHAVAAWMLAAEAAGLVWMAEMVVLWNEGKPRARNFGSLHTSILWFAVPGARHSWESPKRAIYSNIIIASKVPRNIRHHPAQKPVELTTFLISLLSKPDDVVCDPFCGSGSALVSAAICERDYVGIDQDARHCKVAKRRADHWDTQDEGKIYLWINGRAEEV